MAVLSWGKPKVEVGKLGAGAGAPATWNELPEIAQGTAQLTTEQGSKTEALEEGGGVVDVRFDKSKYTFECELFVKKGDEKPIEDEDGVIVENYAVRWSPKDKSLKGRQMQKTSVSVVETWASNEGSRLKYTFMGLVPNEGKILTEYQAPTTP